MPNLARLRRRIALLDALEDYLESDGDTDDALRARLLDTRAALERANIRCYDTVRARIRSGRGRAALTDLLEIDWRADAAVDARDGYDDMDAIIADIIQLDEPGPTTAATTAEMVFYQPTPARHIIDLLRRTAPTVDDTLVDLGAGLGHVAIMTAICTEAQAIGIELEPAYVSCARHAAVNLDLPRARFIEGDARQAPLAEGTVFFLYTPFSGGILRTVLDRLRDQAALRPIRVCSYGPCTRTLAGESWLISEQPPRTGRVAVFSSVRTPQ